MELTVKASTILRQICSVTIRNIIYTPIVNNLAFTLGVLPYSSSPKDFNDPRRNSRVSGGRLSESVFAADFAVSLHIVSIVYFFVNWWIEKVFQYAFSCSCSCRCYWLRGCSSHVARCIDMRMYSFRVRLRMFSKNANDVFVGTFSIYRVVRAVESKTSDDVEFPSDIIITIIFCPHRPIGELSSITCILQLYEYDALPVLVDDRTTYWACFVQELEVTLRADNISFSRRSSWQNKRQCSFDYATGTEYPQLGFLH